MQRDNRSSDGFRDVGGRLAASKATILQGVNLGPSSRGVDFFSSAGGLSLGSRAAGCRIVATMGLDTTAGETFSRDLGGLPAVLAGDRGDLEALDHKHTFDSVVLDTFIGRLPCQAYSRLGRADFVSLTGQGPKEDPRVSPYIAS